VVSKRSGDVKVLEKHAPILEHVSSYLERFEREGGHGKAVNERFVKFAAITIFKAYELQMFQLRLSCGQVIK
jgi:hypothetical protein